MTKYFSTLLVILSSFSSYSQGYYFPPAAGVWDTTSPASFNWCQKNIDSLYSFLDKEKTKSFLVLVNGKIVLEKYFNGHDASTNWAWFSAGKSLRSALIGIAQHEGDININNNTSDYLGNGWSSLNQQQEDVIKVKNHLSMTTGLNEQYFDCTADSCLTFKVNVGTRWYYHNAAYNLTKDILEAATGKNHNTYTQQKIKTPIGMSSGIWIKSGYNHFYLSRARDMARFGILMANKGNWNGNQVIGDTTYVNQMINSSQNLNPSYGYLWWLNGKSSITPPGDSNSYPVSLAPDAPSDIYLAAGYLGQLISISPSQNMIIIRQGLSQDSNLVSIDIHNEIWKRVLKLDCSLSRLEEIKVELNIFPNPANEILRISSTKGVLTIYNILGEAVLRKELKSNNTEIDISKFTKGVYSVVLNSKLGNHIEKLVIKH